MTLAQKERAALAAALHAAGPDAPTLCEGWTTKDLLIHLLVRERGGVARLGILIKQFDPLLQRRSKQLEGEDYGTLVERWRQGLPRWSPLRLLDGMVNGLEHFVHHEDVRRGRPGWEPRELGADDEQALYRALKLFGRVAFSKAPRPVVVAPRGFPRLVFADRHGVSQRGDDVAYVRGDVGEIALWCLGRTAVQLEMRNAEDIHPSGL